MEAEKNKISRVITPVITIIITSIILGFAFQAISPNFSQRGDALKEYDPIARSLADGTGFWNNGEPTARVAPGYPFLLSIIYKFGGGYEAMFILQVFMLAGIGVISYFIAKKFLSSKFAFFAALNIIAWPYLVLYTKLILTEILFIFLFTAAIYALLELIDKKNTKWAILAGVLLGLAALVRPVILLLPFWLTGIALLNLAKNTLSRVSNPERARWSDRSRTERGMRPLGGLAGAAAESEGVFLAKPLLVILAFLLVLAPWTIRNYIQFNTLIPITSGLQYSVSRGYETLDYTKNAPALKLGEVTLKDNILARVKNIYLFWNPGAGGTNAQLLLNQSKLYGAAFVVYKIIFILTVILALLPFALKFKQINLLFEPFDKNRLLLLSIILYFWTMHIFLYPYPRYTLPIMPLVIILAWTSIWFLWHKYKIKVL